MKHVTSMQSWLLNLNGILTLMLWLGSFCPSSCKGLMSALVHVHCKHSVHFVHSQVVVRTRFLHFLQHSSVSTSLRKCWTRAWMFFAVVVLLRGAEDFLLHHERLWRLGKASGSSWKLLGAFQKLVKACGRSFQVCECLFGNSLKLYGNLWKRVIACDIV
jgi:hypothetical protein